VHIGIRATDGTEVEGRLRYERNPIQRRRQEQNPSNCPTKAGGHSKDWSPHFFTVEPMQPMPKWVLPWAGVCHRNTCL